MSESLPFVVFALPRSRTFWASRFLSYGGWACGHDEALHVRALDDVRSWFAQPYVGTVETAAAPFWRLLHAVCPQAKVVVIRRPVSDVVTSLMALGITFDKAMLTGKMERLNAKLDQIERRVPGVLSIQYADLATEDGCAALFEHCLPFKHDHQWWKSAAPVNLQINLPAMLRYAAAHAPQLRRSGGICRQEILAQLWKNRAAPADMEGMTFQEENLETYWDGAQELFAEHCVAVGEAPDQYRRKNMALIERLANVGAWQFMTARCNGRMFGYLATIIGPSLEDPDLKVATQTLFYASPDARGLGMKLQRASIDALKARGGRWEVIQRAGVRGSGHKMGALYRRMGAQDHGHLYRLALEAA
jgi:GNAT superfamily N-acetyltransferase